MTVEALKNTISTTKPKIVPTVKIGRPGYKVTKIRDPVTRQLGLLFQVQYPEIGKVSPRHRIMSAFEQKIEPANKAYQYVVFAADPYETIAFKIQSREIERGGGRCAMFTSWDADSRLFYLQVFFKNTI
jgi:splicing factor 3A subunit 2